MTRDQAISLLIHEPVKLGWAVGFDKLTALHNDWIVDMVRSTQDKTLQAHRGSYKTTCLTIALPVSMLLLPQTSNLFLRKTDQDVKEVIRQVTNILRTPYVQELCELIHGVPLQLVTATASEITTNIGRGSKGTPQLLAMGTNGSMTGKHFDRIYTDDIVNVQDRYSRAERERTRLVYQELQNIKNRGGRIYNTGTPWHKDDAFALMPNITKYDCYSTGLMSDAEIAQIRSSMTPSLFAANYELRHVADEDVIFDHPNVDADPALVEQGECHIDAAYGGDDYTAFTICHKVDGKYYMLGKLWRKHVDDCLDDIQALISQYNAGRIYCEDNGDKGYLAKELRKREERALTYHEHQNKHMKIVTYLRTEWRNVYFVAGTDKEFIEQICDYNENAPHDDAPDSAASQIRRMYNRHSSTYQSVF